MLIPFILVSIFLFIKDKLGIIFFRKRTDNTLINNEITISKIEKPISSTFILCSDYSLSLSFENVEIFAKNNEKDKRYYKSISSLKCSKEDLIRSFYFLEDCIYFCKNEVIYNNKVLLSHVGMLKHTFFICYLNVNPEEIPYERDENFRFGHNIQLNEDLNQIEIEALKLIDWRDKEHWEFWANTYDSENPIGQYCLDRVSKSQ
jgi:hypothetical protein